MNNESSNLDESVSTEPECSHPQTESGSTKKHRIRRTLHFKKKVISFHKNGNSINKTALEFQLDRRVVSRWIKVETKIINTKLQRNRFAVSSEKNNAMYPAMENQLANWISEKRNLGCCITAHSIKSKAIECFNELYKNTEEGMYEFQCSNGWLNNFLKRKNFTLRRITTSGRELPKDSINIIKSFFTECQKVTNESDFEPEILFNMDETTIYLDFPTNFTYESKGAKRVKATTCGGEKAKISAAFTASAAGDKLPIFILVPRKTDMPNYTPPDNVLIVYKDGATFDENTICSFTRKVLATHKELKDLPKIKLVLDSASCHQTTKVKDSFLECGIETLFIPPRMTNLLQQADQEPIPRFGNSKSPGYAKCIEWLSDIWRELNSELIAKSFIHCGISNQFDLLKSLAHFLKNNIIINDYVEDIDESDEIDEQFSTDDRVVFTEPILNDQTAISASSGPSTEASPPLPSTQTSPSMPSTEATPSLPITQSSPSLQSTQSLPSLLSTEARSSISSSQSSQSLPSTEATPYIPSSNATPSMPLTNSTSSIM
ncbi:unnamed protein product [Brachionus calyciflorus]|uniref:HTH CENPB-type domain-containing protein n=1 Tax=Brachionus calyciflorus TaxID=104777 RepID=A0A814N130_9BILA|nr:unnamed protein product [Brachionus calyciflorus]